MMHSQNTARFRKSAGLVGLGIGALSERPSLTVLASAAGHNPTSTQSLRRSR
jgi:hypothetical protein